MYPRLEHVFMYVQPPVHHIQHSCILILRTKESNTWIPNPFQFLDQRKQQLFGRCSMWLLILLRIFIYCIFDKWFILVQQLNHIIWILFTIHKYTFFEFSFFDKFKKWLVASTMHIVSIDSSHIFLTQKKINLHNVCFITATNSFNLGIYIHSFGNTESVLAVFVKVGCSQNLTYAL